MEEKVRAGESAEEGEAPAGSKVGRIALIVLLALLALVGIGAIALSFLWPALRADAPNEYIDVSFAYPSASGDITSNVIYTDDFFAAEPAEYNPSLATASCALALAAAGSGEGSGYEAQTANAAGLLAGLGFEDVRGTDSYGSAPTEDSIALIAGHKAARIDGAEVEIVAVAVRGGNYGREWASNFRVGSGSTHAGFTQARDSARSFLDAYLRTYTGENTVLWFTGYSRGAAVASLLAQYYTATDFGRNVYAYVFEPPATVRTPIENTSAPLEGSAGSGRNIHNIVNPADPVVRLPLEQWGYGRAGVDHWLPDVSDADYAAAEDALRGELRQLSGAYSVADFSLTEVDVAGGLLAEGARRLGIESEYSLFVPADNEKQISQAEFLSSLSEALASGYTGIEDVRVYAREYEDSFAVLASVLSGEDEARLDAAAQAIWADVRANILAYAMEGSAHPQLVAAHERAFDAAGISYNAAELERDLPAAADFLLAWTIAHPSEVATVLANTDCLRSAHDASVTFAWLRSADELYLAAGSAASSTVPSAQ